MTAMMYGRSTTLTEDAGLFVSAAPAPRREPGSSAFVDDWIVLDGEPPLVLDIESRLERAPWFPRLQAELQSALELRANWNGHGERPISRTSIRHAVEILGKLRILQLQPHAVPMSDGSIQIEWHGPSGVIEIEVPPEGAAQGYAYSDDDPDFEEEWMVAGQPNDGSGITKLEELLAHIAG